MLCLCKRATCGPWRLARAASDSRIEAAVTMWPCSSPTKLPPALSHRRMDKNTQQILHSLSIKIQGQLLSTLLPEGMYKQRKGNMHVLIQTEARTHMAAPSAPSSCCSRRCLMTTVCTFGANCCHCCSVCSVGRLPQSHLACCHRHAAAFVLRRRYNVIYFHY